MQNGAEGSANVPADKEAGRTADVANAHGSLRRYLETDPSAVGNRSESYGQGIVYGPPTALPREVSRRPTSDTAEARTTASQGTAVLEPIDPGKLDERDGANSGIAGGNHGNRDPGTKEKRFDVEDIVRMVRCGSFIPASLDCAF